MATIDLIVLGMLKQKPQSAYELQKNVEYRYISDWVKISTPSIYKKVLQLEEKGYLCSSAVREGRMPEKAVYSVTEAGEEYFLRLMKENAAKSVRVYLDFNAVIMSLDFLSDEEAAQLVESIDSEVGSWREKVSGKVDERTHAPLTGREILRQQTELADTLSRWIKEFKEAYARERNERKEER